MIDIVNNEANSDLIIYNRYLFFISWGIYGEGYEISEHYGQHGDGRMYSYGDDWIEGNGKSRVKYD